MGIVYDAQSFDIAVQARWKQASRQPTVLASLTNNLGSSYAVEVLGSLRVEGHFDLGEHGIAALWVHGDLVVDGTYSDPTTPETLVLVGGSLRANAIVTGAQLEVQGDVEARHIAGDYNDYSATFRGLMKSTTFYPADHHFELSRPPEIDLLLGEDAFYRVPEKLRSSLPTRPNRVLCAYLKPAIVSGEGVIDTHKVYAWLRKGRDILLAEPRDIDPELALFPKSTREQLKKDPNRVKRVALPDRNLKEIPPALFRCTNLTSLNLEYNRFGDVSELAKFRHLRTLNLDGNPIRRLPKPLQQLRDLRSLSLRYTHKLKSLPAWFAELHNLRELWLTVSAFSSFPQITTKLPRLRKLWLWHWFDCSTSMARDAIDSVACMKLTHVGFYQGDLMKLPKDISPLARVANVEVVDLALTHAEQRRLKKTVPHVETRWPYERT